MFTEMLPQIDRYVSHVRHELLNVVRPVVKEHFEFQSITAKTRDIQERNKEHAESLLSTNSYYFSVCLLPPSASLITNCQYYFIEL